MTRTWWVNQGIKKGAALNHIVWAPQRDKRGGTPWHWLTMLKVVEGDLLFHYTDQYIVGVSKALGPAVEATRPYSEADAWQKQGWQVPVQYEVLAVPFHRKDIPLSLRLSATSPDGPFNSKGDALQGYLFPVGPQLHSTLASLAGLEAQDRDVDDALPALTLSGSTDIFRTVVARAEQRMLRQRLIAGRTPATCGLCGRMTDAKYLVAAHIKARRHCSEDERRDPNVVMLACLFGCDAAFEAGDLQVDESGYIRLSPNLRASRSEVFVSLEGQKAAAFTRANADYFAVRARSWRE